jgi:hypothetical protein
MSLRCILAALLVAFATGHAAAAEKFTVDEVPAVADVPLADIKPGTIVFSDYRKAKFADADTGLIEFADWSRERPAQKRFLALYPTYFDSKRSNAATPVAGDAKDDTKSKAASEGKASGDSPKSTDTKSASKINSKTKLVRNKAPERLYMYVAEARFLLPRAPASIDLKRYLNIAFLQKMDPSIKHTLITAGDVQPLRAARDIVNRNPNRAWCQEGSGSLCIQSRYQFEGKLPTGIKLANKLFEASRKIANHLTFQSEMRLLPPSEIDQAALVQLTALDSPIVGVVEQSIFYVNQVMQFGKFLVVFQDDPADPLKTVVTAYMALAVRSNVIESKKQYSNVPVLRNLVPAQVLLGNSSFNTGESISAGLPKYTRNRIKAIAGFLAAE